MNPDPEPSSSNSLETSSLDSRANKKKIKKKKKRRKHRKDDSSDPSSSDDYDLSYDSHYRRKRRKDITSEKGSDQNMRNFNGKIADDSV